MSDWRLAEALALDAKALDGQEVIAELENWLAIAEARRDPGLADYRAAMARIRSAVADIEADARELRAAMQPASPVPLLAVAMTSRHVRPWSNDA